MAQSIKDFKADSMLCFYTGGLAGNGIRFQLVFEHPHLKERCEQLGMEFMLLSSKATKPLGFECDIVKMPLIPDIELRQTELKAIYRESIVAIKTALNELYKKQKRNVLFIHRGYTSYGLFAFKQAAAQMEKNGKAMNYRIVWDDSSDPDTFKYSTKLDEDGLPADRFYAPAYKDTYGLIYNWHDNPLPSTRVPPGVIERYMVSQPYTQEYIAWLKKKGEQRKEQARAKFKKHKEFKHFDITDDDLIVTFMASEGCFDPENSGDWMTPEQYKSCEVCTQNILRGLDRAAKEKGIRVFVPVADTCIKFFGNEFTDRVIPIPLKVIPHDIYMDLMVGADMNVQRASHSLCASQAAALNKLVFVAVMPAEGYMDVEVMAEDIVKRRLGIVEDWADKRLGEKIVEHIEKDRQGVYDHMKKKAMAEFDKMHTGKKNIFKTIGRITGREEL